MSDSPTLDSQPGSRVDIRSLPSSINLPATDPLLTDRIRARGRRDDTDMDQAGQVCIPKTVQSCERSVAPANTVCPIFGL